MFAKAKKFTTAHPRLGKVLGLFFVLIGVIALITPFTPGALLLLFIGFEFMGLHFLFMENLKRRIFKSDKTTLVQPEAL